MTRVGLVLDRRFEEHDTGPGHVERPARLARVRTALDAAGLVSSCQRVEPTDASDVDLERAHGRDYIAHVETSCRAGSRQLDSMDTAVCPESAAIARQAAGALCELGERVVRGDLRRGFAVVRPPGHHAERDQAMGFCLFNNVVVAARRLQAVAGVERVFVYDWDVHHGNGTQHILEDDPTVFYASTHQWPLYPGTGAAEERGIGAGEGATLNVPLPPGTGSERFLEAIHNEIVPAGRAFDPDLVLVSAGFDAHRADPLAQLEVDTEAFGEATRALVDLAEECCSGRFVSVLEGGYDLDALAACSELHLRTLLEYR